MEAIRHYLIIKTTPEKVFNAISTQEGLESWWAKQTVARPEVGFTNTFILEKLSNEFKVTQLINNRKAEWLCVNSIDEWIGTTVSFDLEEENGNTILRFAHSGWREINDMFAKCNYGWGRFMSSLKLYCETGNGTPV
jgi:uncharacterized protein YndB with AHSA1/START domain